MNSFSFLPPTHYQFWTDMTAARAKPTTATIQIVYRRLLFSCTVQSFLCLAFCNFHITYLNFKAILTRWGLARERPRRRLEEWLISIVSCRVLFIWFSSEIHAREASRSRRYSYGRGRSRAVWGTHSTWARRRCCWPGRRGKSLGGCWFYCVSTVHKSLFLCLMTEQVLQVKPSGTRAGDT